nr:helix-turn-helix domain-containing protein [Parvimonas parva]
MYNNCNTKHKHLTIDLRKLIEKWKKEGKSNREIARLLCKNHQTINNKIKRSTVIQRTTYEKLKKVYKVEFTQIIYYKNKRNYGRKSKVDYIIRNKVTHYLKYKHTGEFLIHKIFYSLVIILKNYLIIKHLRCEFFYMLYS